MAKSLISTAFDLPKPDHTMTHEVEGFVVREYHWRNWFGSGKSRLLWNTGSHNSALHIDFTLPVVGDPRDRIVKARSALQRKLRQAIREGLIIHGPGDFKD